MRIKKTRKEKMKMAKPKLGSGKRFQTLANKMAREGVNDPDAVAASIGRKKYGNKKMNSMAKKGKARHEKNRMSDHNY
jgi:hypothetical protein